MQLVVNGRFLSQPVTGVQRYGRELLNALDATMQQWPKWQVKVLVPSNTIDLPSYKNLAVQRVGKLTGHLWEQLELPFFVRGDALFCPANTAPIVSLNSKVRTVVTIHDLSYLYYPSAYTTAFKAVYNLVIPQVLNKADVVITVSNAEMNNIVNSHPRAVANIISIPNGNSSFPITEDDHDFRELSPYILYVGSFSKRKNFPAIISVATRLLENYPDLRFVFVGGSPSVFNKIDLSGVRQHERMVFVGQLNTLKEIHSYYSSAVLLLFPSLFESSGLPPTEAMSAGCPVVASNIPALVERCGEAALYCDPLNPDDIYRAACEVLTNNVLRSQLISFGYKRAGLYTWKRCAEDTMNAIVGAA